MTHKLVIVKKRHPERDWLSVGKECCPRLSRRLWGGKIYELP